MAEGVSERLPFIGPSYQSRVLAQNNRKLVNMFVQTEDFPDDSKFPISAYSTPGLTEFSTERSGQTRVRGLHVHKGVLYAVISDKFYTVASDGAVTQEGAMNTNTGFVSIASTDREILIVDESNGYSFVPATSTFTQISDADFPPAPLTVTAQDGFFIVNEADSDTFYISAYRDGLDWSALDFEDAEVESDDIVAVYSYRQILHVFGDVSTETYINTGNVNFPFERQADGIIQVGCAAAGSIAGSADSLFWLGSTKNGDNMVMQQTGVQLNIISNDAIEYQLARYNTISDAYGFVYRLEGKEFYVLSFPTENVTWVYNKESQLWHQWSSRVDNVDGIHRSSSHAFVYNKNIVGDYFTGILYELDPDTYTDNGTTIKRILTTSPIHLDNNVIGVYNLRVDVESGQGLSSGQGSDPQIMLQVSRNGGYSFGNELWRSAGEVGQYNKRAEWSRLGSSRQFVFKLTMTDPIKWTVLGATAIIEREAA